MKREWLPLLQCPATGEKLAVDVTREDGGFVVEGTLRTATTSYPVVNGIPRFRAGGELFLDFGRQWHTWKRVQFEAENIGGPMEAILPACSSRSSGHPDLAGKTVLDLGCGPGRFPRRLPRQGAKRHRRRLLQRGRRRGGEICVRRASAAADPGRCAGARRPQAASPTSPIRSACSTTTPSSAKGFAELHARDEKRRRHRSRRLRQGLLQLSSPVTAWRKFFNLFDEDTKYRLAMAYARTTTAVLEPLFGWSYPTRNGIKLLFPYVSLPDRRWAVLDIRQRHPRLSELAHAGRSALLVRGQRLCAAIKSTDWGPSHVGVKT